MNCRIENLAGAAQIRDREERGFSLVELMLSLSLVVLTLILLQSTLFSAIRTRVATAEQDHRNALAYDFVQRLTAIPFGKAGDPPATPAQLSEFFDDDQDLGTVVLKNLETPAGSDGHSFTTTLEGVTTLWRIAVTADLDGDGLTTGFREGRPDLLMIEVYAEDRLMFRTERAAGFPNTRKD